MHIAVVDTGGKSHEPCASGWRRDRLVYATRVMGAFKELRAPRHLMNEATATSLHDKVRCQLESTLIEVCVSRLVFSWTGLEPHLGPLLLVYPMLIVAYACGLWLLLYRA